MNNNLMFEISMNYSKKKVEIHKAGYAIAKDSVLDARRVIRRWYLTEDNLKNALVTSKSMADRYGFTVANFLESELSAEEKKITAEFAKVKEETETDGKTFIDVLFKYTTLFYPLWILLTFVYFFLIGKLNSKIAVFYYIKQALTQLERVTMLGRIILISIHWYAVFAIVKHILN